MQNLFMLSDSQWDKVKAIIEPKERSRKVSLRVIMSGIVYLLDNGCKWRGLPPQYGHYKLVWYYYHNWMRFGVLERLLYILSIGLRKAQGLNEEPTLLIIDSQSVKTPAGTSVQTGYDNYKRIKGRKRHLATDSKGNVMAVGVTAASVHDRPGAQTLQQDVEDLQRVRKIIADGAYKGAPPFDAGGKIQWEIIEKKATGGRFKVLPKRWVVERTLAWLQNFRRLSKDYEKTTLMSKAMILMAAIILTLRKLMTYF